MRKEAYLKPRTDLSINSNDAESLCIEIHHKNVKNILFRAMYRTPRGNETVFEKFCENLLSANDKTLESIIFAGDLNINILDYKSNKKVQHFYRASEMDFTVEGPRNIETGGRQEKFLNSRCSRMAKTVTF